MERKNYKKVYAIYWQDAAYSFRKRMPEELPPIEITTGTIVSKNKNFVNIATNLNYYSEKRKVKAKDGFLIPTKTIVKIKEIGHLNE